MLFKMIRSFFFFLSIVLAFPIAFSQNGVPESLRNKNEIMWLKADNYFNHNDFTSSVALLKELYELSDQLEPERRLSVLHRLSTSFLLIGDYQQAHRYGLELYNADKPKELEYYDIPAFLNLVSVYNWENQLSSSSDLCGEMLPKIKSINIPKEKLNDYMCKFYVQVSVTNNRLGNHEEALKWINEAKKYANSSELKTLCDFNSALIYKELGDDDSAIDLYARILDGNANDVNSAIALGNYLELLIKHKRVADVISTFNNKKSLISIFNEPRVAIGCYANIAQAYAATGDYESAYSYMAKAKAQSDTIVAKLKNDSLILRGENPEISDSDRNRKINVHIFIIFGLIFVIIAVTLIYFLLKGKSRLKKVVDENKAVQEDLVRQSYSERETINAIIQLSELSDTIVRIQETSLNERMSADKKLLTISTLLKQYNASKNKNEIFNHFFSKLNGPFLRRLKEAHPNISANEERLCSLIVAGFSTKEIAKTLGCAPRAVETAKYRLKKKLQLSFDQSTTDYLHEIMTNTEV